MGGKIFINYRRSEDLGATAGRLREHLERAFGRDQVFMDVVDIPVGIDYKAHLNSQLAECDVILVVIGSKWLKVRDKAGQRRLDRPEDPVAIEIAAALERDIYVIPVLVEGARIPNASDLPESLKPLADRMAVEVRHPSFDRDADALVARMRKAVPALLDSPEPPQIDHASIVGRGTKSFIVRQVLKLLETANSYLVRERHRGWGRLIVFVLAALLCFGLVTKFGGEMKFDSLSGFSLQPKAASVVKVIKMFRPPKYRF